MFGGISQRDASEILNLILAELKVGVMKGRGLAYFASVYNPRRLSSNATLVQEAAAARMSKTHIRIDLKFNCQPVLMLRTINDPESVLRACRVV